MKPAAPLSLVPALELLAQPIPRTQVLFRGTAPPAGRIELCCDCRRNVVRIDPGEHAARCTRCTRARRRRPHDRKETNQ